MNIFRLSHRFALAFLGLSLVTACFDDPVSVQQLPLTSLEDQVWATSLGVDLATMTRLSSGVYIKDDVVGAGATVSGSPRVLVFYAGYLATGFRFDFVPNPGTAADIPLERVIPGFAQGMQGMKVGGKRRILIPSALGYGELGKTTFPATPISFSTSS